MPQSSQDFLELREAIAYNEQKAALQANTDKILYLQGKDAKKEVLGEKVGKKRYCFDCGCELDKEELICGGCRFQL